MKFSFQPQSAKENKWKRDKNRRPTVDTQIIFSHILGDSNKINLESYPLLIKSYVSDPKSGRGDAIQVSTNTRRFGSVE